MNRTFSNFNDYGSANYRMKVAYNLDQKSILNKYNPLIQGVKKYRNGDSDEFSNGIPRPREHPASLDRHIRFHFERSQAKKEQQLLVKKDPELQKNHHRKNQS